MAKILVVEDDADVAYTIKESLEMERHVVDIVGNGDEALDRLRFYDYDVAVLDWMLPGLPGVEVCRQYRSLGGQIPILMLTALAEIGDRVGGLDAGADDYLTKPFDILELAARIRALLRRPEAVSDRFLHAGDIALDTQAQTVSKQGVEIRLLPKEFALLSFLMRHPDQVFTGEALLNRVWSSESDATSDALRSTLKRLRKKIDRPGARSLIQTLPGQGYKFSRDPAGFQS